MKITIRNLRSVEHLEFQLPRPGAYLLTGQNGSGKTSLLVCLDRITNRYAFQLGFRSSAHSSLDSHRGASVQYEVGGESVTYRYGQERWAPFPKKNSELLRRSPYPDVTFIAADSSRVEPSRQEFAPRRVRRVETSLRDGMNAIFDTSRFDELSYINISRGGRTRAYLVRKSGTAPEYYSERNFSLGELCVLKMLVKLNDIADNALVVIDELELAVHPRAQVRLFQHLDRVAAAKNLTVIFSTHSVTLIKSVNRRQILFLKKDGGRIETISGCYPTFALGQITAGEEVAPDCVVYVEDEAAKQCFTAMLNLYRARLQGRSAVPHVACASIGGFQQVLDFIEKNPQILPATTRVMALLDKDVEVESLAEYRARGDHVRLAQFARLSRQLRYLPWTPEVGLVELLCGDLARSEQWLRDYFGEPRFAYTANWGEGRRGLAGGQLRDFCKQATSQLSDLLSGLTGRQKDSIKEALFALLVAKTDEASILRLVGGAIQN